jgi:alkaline phosphatase
MKPTQYLSLTVLALLMAAAFTQVDTRAQATAPAPAKNVIFFLGDGMGPTVVTASRLYKYSESGKLQMESLPDGRTARVKTYSLDAQTTDSAPSMAAYMTGVKMNNEVISMSANTKAYDAANKSYISGSNTTCPLDGSNGTPVATLLELAKAQGKGTGSITTTRLTHATPAATFSHLCHRDGENDIAQQAVPGNARYNAKLSDGVDVLMGGGLRHFIPSTTTGSKRTDTLDLVADMQAKGYTYAPTGTALRAINVASTNKLLGLFNLDHMNWEVDRVKKAVDEPSLAEMTEAAINLLKKNQKGYFLMVEGGRIDHALHGTNAKRALEDTIAFDDAIKKALSLVDLKDTLIVVTADHDHTLTMNGYGAKGAPILGLVQDIRTKQPAKAADSLPYTALVFGNGGGPRKATRDDPSLVDTTADDYLQEVGVPLGAPGSETHGGGDVMLWASGVGASSFKGTLDNTKVFSLVKAAAAY